MSVVVRQIPGSTLATFAREGRGQRRHPTTTEIMYTADEVEFMEAMRQWKHRTGCKWPTWREVFHVLLSLGYDR